jgi:hypothetical protein
MQRNWDLLRWIMNQAQSCKGGYPLVLTDGTAYGGRHYTLNIGELDFEEVYEHILLLRDSDLAEVQDFGSTFSGPAGAAIVRLTMTGHDFLEAAQDETLWQKAMTVVNEKGGAVTVGVLIQILSTLVKQSFGLS